MIQYRGMTCVPGCCYEESDMSMKNHPMTEEELERERKMLPDLTAAPYIKPGDRIMTVGQIEQERDDRIKDLEEKLARMTVDRDKYKRAALELKLDSLALGEAKEKP